MRDDTFLSDSYRRVLDELRRVERRVAAAAAPGSEVASPDPTEVRQRFVALLAEIRGDAVERHRDVASTDFLLGLHVQATTLDVRLGGLGAWDGALLFRKEPLGAENPPPEPYPTDLVDQIARRLGTAADEAGSVVEHGGEATVLAGRMPADLARVYLLRLWIAPPPTEPDGPRSLASLRSRLSAQLPFQDDLDAERLFPDAYRRRASPQGGQLMDSVRPWVALVSVLALFVLLVGALVWSGATADARDLVDQILASPTTTRAPAGG